MYHLVSNLILLFIASCLYFCIRGLGSGNITIRMTKRSWTSGWLVLKPWEESMTKCWKTSKMQSWSKDLPIRAEICKSKRLSAASRKTSRRSETARLWNRLHLASKSKKTRLKTSMSLERSKMNSASLSRLWGHIVRFGTSSRTMRNRRYLTCFVPTQTQVKRTSMAALET